MEEKGGDRLDIRRPRRVGLRLIGGLWLGFGAVVAVTWPSPVDAPRTPVLLGVAWTVSFLAPGLSTLLWTSGCVLDRVTGTATRYWGLAIPLLQKPGPRLQDFTEVRIYHRFWEGAEDSYRSVVVELRGAHGALELYQEDVALSADPFLESWCRGAETKARRIGSEAAEFLGLPLTLDFIAERGV